MAIADPLDQMQRLIWDARLPLEIRVASSECRTYDQVDPYLVSCPRLTYLPTLLPKLLAFFSPHLIVDSATLASDSGCFTYESVPLKWHFPIGLLYDIHVLSTEQINSSAIPQHLNPFKLTVHFSPGEGDAHRNHVPVNERALNDAFINSVKEADFLRSGTAKPIMWLSAADSKLIWTSTQSNDLKSFVRVHETLWPLPGQLRNIPLRTYIPSTSEQDPERAQVKVVQGHFPPIVATNMATTTSQLRSPSIGQPQTLGTALHSLMPTLFPSRRSPILAKPILHGAQVPMTANLEELARKCCYADGWINIVVAMTN